MARIQLKLWSAPFSTLSQPAPIGLAEGEVGIDADTNILYKRPDGNPEGTIVQVGGSGSGGGGNASVLQAKVAATTDVNRGGLQEIDRIMLVEGDLVLLPLQNDMSQTGLYTASAGMWTRAPKADTWQALSGAIFIVEHGATNAGSLWVCVADNGGVLDSSPLKVYGTSSSRSNSSQALLDADGNTILSGDVALDFSRVGGASRPQDGATRNVFRGDWLEGDGYAIGDAVIWNGNGWTATLAHTATVANRPPDEKDGTSEYWALSAVKGADGTAFQVVITSSVGTMFRVGEGMETTLRANVFRNGEDVTDTFPPGSFRWSRRSLFPREPPYDDETWNAQHTSSYAEITINVDDVQARAVFTCDVIL